MIAFSENLAWRICRPRMVEPPKNRYVGGGSGVAGPFFSPHAILTLVFWQFCAVWCAFVAQHRVGHYTT